MHRFCVYVIFVVLCGLPAGAWATIQFRGGSIQAGVIRANTPPEATAELSILRANTLSFPGDIDGDCTESDWTGATSPAFETNQLPGDSSGQITTARLLWVNAATDRLCWCVTVADTSHQAGSYTADQFPSESDFVEVLWSPSGSTNYSTATKKVVVNLDEDVYDAQGTAPPTNTLNDTTWTGNVTANVTTVSATSWTNEACADLGGTYDPGDLLRFNMRVRDRDGDGTHVQAIMRGTVESINQLTTALLVELSNTQTVGVADVTAPVVASCTPSNVTQSSFTVTCSVNEASTCQLFWGPDGGARTNTSATSQSVSGQCSNLIAAGLTAGTAYDFHMAATDSAGNTGTSSQGNVTTASPPVAGCDHWVNQTAQGTGDHSSSANAGLASGVWSKLTAGEIVCFKDGTYTGANSMITPTTGLSGTKTAYITIKAENDGGAFIDGQNARNPLSLNGSRYLIVQGFDIGNSSGHAASVSGSTCPEPQPQGCSAAPVIIMRRLVVFDACATCNSKVLQTTQSEYVLWEDVAAWGTGRKVVEAYQSRFTTWRRPFVVWGGGGNDTAQVQMGLSMAYQSYHNTLENGMLSWNRATGEPARQSYAIIGMDRLDSTSINPYYPTYGLSANLKVLGTLTYVRSNFTYDVGTTRGSLWTAGLNGLTDYTIQDFVGYIQSGTYNDRRPVTLQAHTGATPAGKFATRVTNIGAVNASIGSGWIQNNVNNFALPSAANIYTSTTQARLCFRYVNGQVTTTKLWPWPMDSRIVAAAARASSSLQLNDLVDTSSHVTDLIGDIFGTIPATCTD